MAMRRMVNVGVLVLVLSVAAGLVVPAISSCRKAAARLRCWNNLKQIALALETYNDCYHHFPTGTLSSPGLPPGKRLSWCMEICPAFMLGGHETKFDRAKSWDAEVNCPPRWEVREETHDDKMHYHEQQVGELKVFLCPANPARTTPPLPSPTHYLGVAGVGEAAAELPLSDPRAGVFGYDRKTTLADIKDGTATTLLAVETTVDNGPWTAGGRPTVRSLDPARGPYLGTGGQFTSNHRLLNAAFAEGSVRGLSDKVSPAVLEALATVAGGEEAGQVGDQ
jgi:hypothetical protein